MIIDADFQEMNHTLTAKFGVFVNDGQGGNVVVDQAYNPESSNAQSGKAVAEAIASIEIPEVNDITIDQTYEPLSENAQSGKALSPMFRKKIELWKPNTEYKEDDEVLGFYQELDYEGYSYAIVMKCLKSHTSPDDIDYPNLAEDFGRCWTYNSLRSEIAYSAVMDSEHNYISETYATKGEVNNKPTVYSGDFEDGFLVLGSITKIANDVIQLFYDPNTIEFDWIKKVKVGDMFVDTNASITMVCISAEEETQNWQELSNKDLYKQIGDIETALDSIIEIQNSLIGGGNV